MMRKNLRKYVSLQLVLIKTLAGFAPRLHLFERFSDLSSGLDCKGGISRLSQALCITASVSGSMQLQR